MAHLFKRPRLNVGIKVALMVIAFEVMMLSAYVILTQILVDQQQFLERINANQQQAIIVLLTSSLVLAGYLTYAVITRIFGPVSQLTRVTEEIIHGDLTRRLDIRTNDELEVLADRFNEMAATLKQERDLLEQKVKDRTYELEEAQKKEIDKQKEIVRLKDEFLFVAAHELRTPVTAIRWSLESIDPKNPTKETNLLAIRDAMSAGRNLAGLVEDLLNMARLDYKRIGFKKELVDMRAVTKATLSELEQLAAQRKITFTVEAPEHMTIDALADERRVREVLINLVGNAIKFNKEGGRVWIRLGASAEKVRLDVVDNGPGILTEEQSHLFEKFWRSKATTGVEGSGLGLFITKRLVEGMDGTITFSSEPGKGTTFTVILPAEPHAILK